MAKKRELDKLSLDMIECKKAGFGCHYGAWKALQGNTIKKEEGIPEGWQVCKRLPAIEIVNIGKNEILDFILNYLQLLTNC